MKLATIKLDKINKAVDGLSSAIRTTSVLASNIGKKVRESNQRLKERISNANKNFQRRLEGSRKKQREELIEALGIGGAMRRTGQVIKNTAKGFLGRIMEFLSVVLIGWAIINIPKIIKGAQGLIDRLRKFYKVGEQLVTDLTQFLTNFGKELSQLFSSLIQFDFKPLQDKIGSIMTKLQNDFRTVERGLIKDVSDLIDLKEEDIVNMMGGETDQIKAMDEKIYEQGIDKEKYDELPDSIKTAIRVLAKRNLDQGKPMFDEFDLEDLQKAESVSDFEQVLKDNRFVLKEIDGVQYYVPPELVNTKGLGDEIKDAFEKYMEGPDYNNEEESNIDGKKVSFNPIKNDRNFELDKKSKDVFIPFSNIFNNTFMQRQNNSDSFIALNSIDTNIGYASFENQMLNSIG